MALSLSSPQFKQAIHTPPLPNPLLHSHSTPRQFTGIHDVPNNETLSINQIVGPDPLLLTTSTTSPSDPEHVVYKGVNEVASGSRREAPDLPSWTPLKASGDDETLVVSDSEADEFPTGNAPCPPMRQPTGPPTNGRATIETTTSATGTPKLKSSSTDAKPTPKGKKARFDGVLITTKPSPPFSKLSSSSRSTPSAPAPSSRTRQLTLVDALARTFNANRHMEDPFRRHSRPTLAKDDDGSPATAGPQTDAETTEAEDEALQLNTRLAHSPLKRLYPQTRSLFSENVSENNSEGDASLLPQRGTGRPIKRLKAISYDANASLVDAALATVEAPLGWDAELDYFTREDDDFSPPGTPMTQDALAASHCAEEDVKMVVDQVISDPTLPIAGKVPLPPSAPVPTRVAPTQPRLLLPYLSLGDRFRQRLNTIYGENATVRTDRVARPRPADLDLYAPSDDPDDDHRESSPSPSESAASVSAASALEEGASAVPSTHITSQSPSNAPSADIIADDVNLEQSSGNQLSEVVTGIAQPSFDTSEETMGGWIIALQRLVKGKIRITEEDLETVSINLAEIESVKNNLDESASMTSELRESVKQLSELHEIPFGDRNKLRQRAEVIFHTWPSVKELGAS